MTASRPRPFALVSFVFAVALSPQATAAFTVDFEDVGASLPPGTAVNDSQGFTSGGVGFNNTFTDFGGGFSTWAGFAYSNVRDSMTPGYGNQYAAWNAWWERLNLIMHKFPYRSGLLNLHRDKNKYLRRN